jgi:hypothetical protein
LRDTPYATELKTVTDVHGQGIERLFIKEKDREEIRFSWWPGGATANRPLDLPEDELLALMTQTLPEGVFSDRFCARLLRALAEHLEPKIA